MPMFVGDTADARTNAAIDRARVVQKEIKECRQRMNKGPYNLCVAAMLVSLDAELDRLCTISGVMGAIADDLIVADTKKDSQ